MEYPTDRDRSVSTSPLTEVLEMFLTVEADLAAISRKVQKLPASFPVNEAESLLTTAMNATEEARTWLTND